VCFLEPHKFLRQGKFGNALELAALVFIPAVFPFAG
jgi:hypothetical protein